MKITEPKFEFVRGTYNFNLIDDWCYTYHGYNVIVPRGFITDLASIPRFLWPIISPNGPLRYGAIGHDLFYQYGFLLARFNPAQIYPERSMLLRQRYKEKFGPYVPVFVGENQKFGDVMFKEVNRSASVNTLNIVQNNAAYLALRCFGFKAWNQYRKYGSTAYNTNSLNLPSI